MAGHRSLYTCRVLRRKVRLGTTVLLTIGAFDLVTTLMWLNGGGREGNPFFASLAQMGSVPLVLGKLLFLFGPVLLIEYARTKRPWTAEIGTWAAVFLYAYLYVGHLLGLARG